MKPDANGNVISSRSLTKDLTFTKSHIRKISQAITDAAIDDLNKVRSAHVYYTRNRESVIANIVEEIKNGDTHSLEELYQSHLDHMMQMDTDQGILIQYGYVINDLLNGSVIDDE